MLNLPTKNVLHPSLQKPKLMRFLFLTLCIAMVLMFVGSFFALRTHAATCTAPSRSNVAANSILTSTEYNTSLNTVYSALAAGSLDLGCAATSSLDDTATLNSTTFNALLNAAKEGCTASASDTNTISIDRCMMAVNGNYVRTAIATTVTWGCSGCSVESASTVYYVYAKTGSSGSTLTLLISTVAPNADGYDASNNRAIAIFVNNAGSNIESVSNAIRGDVFEKRWFSDANLAGANISLGTASVATYAGLEDAGLTLTQQTGSVQTFVPCSATNSSSGTTCAAGLESTGISFINPFISNIEVCATFGWAVDIAAGGAVAAAFAIVNTPNAAQTVSNDGNSHLSQNAAAPAAATIQAGGPFTVCGLFKSVAAGKVTFRVFYEQLVSGGGIASSVVAADANAAVGQRDVHITARPVN